ncbi:zinc finger protein [Stylonychia lemnae]|uniref:Zinc finger protein n=1 Tax=Stylonychia lemnae TaxID=5949 RepID=A0A078AD66_STYLE|nr:zinc finger protein [Stylonychia lemnae]|eukprot:CDW80184.1 zinc finger protein [Stylonychia lemnae]
MSQESIYFRYNVPQQTYLRTPLQDITHQFNKSQISGQNFDKLQQIQQNQQRFYFDYTNHGMMVQTANPQFQLMNHQQTLQNKQLQQVTQKNTKVDKAKYKTEMCKNWIEFGQCRYGHKCQFAHGNFEMINKEPQNEKYKSKPCKSFSEKGYCLYGKRCLFKHEDRALEDLVSLNYVHKLLETESKLKSFSSNSKCQMAASKEKMNQEVFSEAYFEQIGYRPRRLALFANITEKGEDEMRQLEIIKSHKRNMSHFESDGGETFDSSSRNFSLKSFSSGDSYSSTDDFNSPRYRSESLVQQLTEDSPCNINQNIENSLIAVKSINIYREQENI